MEKQRRRRRGRSGQRRRRRGLKRPGQVRHLIIHNPTKLQELLRGKMGDRTQSAFAKEIGIRQPLLSQLLRGRKGAMSRKTFDALLPLFSHGGMAFRAVFENAGTQGTQLDYEAGMTVSAASPERDMGLSRDARRRLRRLLRLEKGRASRAGRDTPFTRAVRDFYETAEQRGVTDRRRLAALGAVLEPLNRYFTWGGMEAGIHELNERDLARFVAWGLQRETMLLKLRAEDFVQANHAIAERHARNERRRDHDVGATSVARSWDFLNAEVDEAARHLRFVGLQNPATK